MANYNNNEDQKQRPFDEVLELKKRKEFSNREVGLTHPDNSAFMRVADSGEIEIFAAPGIGVVINPHTRSISFFADSIKFYSREDDGLRWNGLSFNPAADSYTEPTFVKTNNFSNNPAYHRTSYYLNNLDNLDNLESPDPITIIGEYGLSNDQIPNSNLSSDENLLNIKPEEFLLLKEYSKNHSDSEVSLVQELLQGGYSFSEAIKKMESTISDKSENLENFPWITNDLD